MNKVDPLLEIEDEGSRPEVKVKVNNLEEYKKVIKNYL